MAKADLRIAALANLATAGRSGEALKFETPEGIATGLELSGVQYKPSSWFKENSDNAVFSSLKTQAYMDNLKRDILDAGTILNPLVAMPDGTLIEGHSRIIIIRQLEQEGRWSERVPVRMILSNITADEIRKRVYLGNLSRFEIDVNTRAILYREIWPDFAPTAATVAVMSATDAIREVAASAGIKERQAWNERGILQKADEIAKAEGKPKAEPEHVARARAERNAVRRKSPVTATVAVDRSSSEHQGKEAPQQAALLIREQIEKGSPDYANGVRQTLEALRDYGVLSSEGYATIIEIVLGKV